ncbi:MAG: zinc ribbon domain-containing protein [Gemmatimonadaceae bacterium]|nr:zinc ribbon domain-containing protein [Gemmatimonadaceae bacterium]
MPTYEFRCEAGHTFDRFLKMSEAPLELACAECGELATRQMSGGAGLVFKGSGFYLTDYGRAGQKTPAGEGGASTSGDSKGGDSKPADSKSSKTESAPAASTKTSTTKSDKSSSTKTSKPSE